MSAPPPSASAPAPLDRAAALRLGRKLAQASKWSEAAAALARAASVEPSDAVLLSELGWAQLKAGDLDPSRATSERALPLAADPRVRAQILYNLGRVAEAKHEDATAKERYEQSLALRPNRTVQARLEALGGALSAAPAGAPTPRLPCDRVFANRQALCDCLLADREVLASRDDAPRSCGAEPNTPGDREGELSVLRFGVDERALGEAAHLLAANVGGGLRPVADLGRDYRGTDGAESKVAVRGFEARSLEGRRLLLVRSDLEATDASEGETYETVTKRVTVCVLRDGTRETACPWTLPVEILDSLSIPESATASKGGYRHEARFDLAMADAQVTLSLASGMRSLAPKSALGPHPLW